VLPNSQSKPNHTRKHTNNDVRLATLAAAAAAAIIGSRCDVCMCMSLQIWVFSTFLFCCFYRFQYFSVYMRAFVFSLVCSSRALCCTFLFSEATKPFSLHFRWSHGDLVHTRTTRARVCPVALLDIRWNVCMLWKWWFRIFPCFCRILFSSFFCSYFYILQSVSSSARHRRWYTAIITVRRQADDWAQLR